MRVLVAAVGAATALLVYVRGVGALATLPPHLPCRRDFVRSPAAIRDSPSSALAALSRPDEYNSVDYDPDGGTTARIRRRRAAVSGRRGAIARSLAVVGLSSPAVLLLGLGTPSPTHAYTVEDPVGLAPPPPPSAPPGVANPDPRAVTTLLLDAPGSKAGLELYDVTIGTPPRTVAAVRSVQPGGAASRVGVKPGTILLGNNYSGGAKSVYDRLRVGPYPVVLQFFDLAGGGDAIGDLGRPLIAAEDALQTARANSGEVPWADTQGPLGSGLQISVVKKSESGGDCGVKSRRGDVLEINYVARIGGKDGPVYDSSAERGTGQPYMFVLGSGDIVRGVDLGTYDMCPGEVRELSIPSALGYGRQGSRLYRIPGSFRLFWTVELVRSNSVMEGRR